MEEEIKSGAKAWIKSIRPPNADSPEKSVQAWRWAIAVSTGVTAVSLAVHILIACGFMTFLHPGFASAADVQQMREERKMERETDLESKIMEVRAKQCVSENPVKQLYTETLQKMLIEYTKITARSYPLPSCDDFK